MSAPRPVAPVGAAAFAHWASRSVQPCARRSQQLVSRGRSAFAALRRKRASMPRTAAAAAAAAAEAKWGPYGESTNVVHITGLRLYADESQKDARGAVPAANVQAVLRHAAARVVEPPPAAIIITGDVAADRSAVRARAMHVCEPDR